MAKVYDRNLVVKLLDPFLSQVTISPDEDRRKGNDNFNIINSSCSNNKSVVNINKKRSKNKNKKKGNISNANEIHFDYNIPANNIMCWERSNLIPDGIATNGQIANGQMANVREFDRAQRLKNRQQQQQQLQGLKRRSWEEQKRKRASIEIIDLCDVDDYEDQDDYQEIEDDEEEDEGQVYYVEKETDTHSNHITCGMVGKDFLESGDDSSISTRVLVGIIPVENIYARRGDDDDDHHHQDHFSSNAHNYDDVAFSGDDSDEFDKNEDNEDDASVSFCIDRSMAAKIKKSYRNDNCQQFNCHNEINSGIVQCSSSNSSISASSSSIYASSSSCSSGISASSSSSSSISASSSSISASNSSCTGNLDEDNRKVLFIDDYDVRIQINNATNCDNNNALHHLESDMSVIANREMNNNSYNESNHDSNNDNKSNCSNNNNYMNGKNYDNLTNNDTDDDNIISSNGNSNINKCNIFVGSTQGSIFDLIDLSADSPTDNRTYSSDENNKRDSLESVEIIFYDQNEEEINQNELIRNKIDDFQQSKKSRISDFHDNSLVLSKRKMPLEETEEYYFAKKKSCVESEQKDLEKSKEISHVGEFKLFSPARKSIKKVMPLAADSGSNNFGNDIDTTSTNSFSKIMNHVSYYRDKKGNTYSRTNDSAFYNS